MVQIALFNALVGDGLSSHSAWRASFAVVPVPILLTVAILTLMFGTDCPAGKWSERHTLPATAVAVASGHQVHLDDDELKFSKVNPLRLSVASYHANVLYSRKKPTAKKKPVFRPQCAMLMIHPWTELLSISLSQKR